MQRRQQKLLKSTWIKVKRKKRSSTKQPLVKCSSSFSFSKLAAAAAAAAVAGNNLTSSSSNVYTQIQPTADEIVSVELHSSSSSLPARTHVDLVFIVGDTDASRDTYCINVTEKSTDAAQAGVWEYMALNPCLFSPLIVSEEHVIPGRQVRCPISFTLSHPRNKLPKSFAITEASFLLILLLQRLQREDTDACRSVVLVPASSIDTFLLSSSHTSMPTDRSSRSGAFACHLSPIVTSSSRSTIHAAWSRWDTLHAYTISVVFLPTIMWFSAHGQPLEVLHKITHCMLKPHGHATLLPSPSLEQCIERKDFVYQHLSSYMLPSTWIQRSHYVTESEVQNMCTKLLDQLPDGYYVLKGSFSWGAICTVIVEVIHGTCESLQREVSRMLHTYHQPAIGIQRYIPTFHQHAEYRFWYFAQPDLFSDQLRWQMGIMVKTSPNQEHKHGGIVAELASTIDADAAACGQLVEHLMASAYAAKWITHTGLRSLRIDCGYDPVSKRPFINELATAPFSTLWTDLHKAPGVLRIADEFAAQIQHAFSLPSSSLPSNTATATTT